MNIAELAELLSAENHACVVWNGELHFDDRRGIAPVIAFRDTGILKGALIADKVIGKAAACFIFDQKPAALYAAVISRPGLELLTQSGIAVTYGTLTERIVNREGTDICPMEKLALAAGSPGEARMRITKKLKELQTAKKG